MRIIKAAREDLRTILDLQYLAYQSEARLLNNYNIPPLMQTYRELLEEFNKGIVLKAINMEGDIVGSVRGYVDAGTLHIRKLIVHPDMQGKCIGTQLLQRMEGVCPQPRYELFTSCKSVRNLNLYHRLGYVCFMEEKTAADLRLVYMEKFVR